MSYNYFQSVLVVLTCHHKKKWGQAAGTCQCRTCCSRLGRWSGSLRRREFEPSARGVGGRRGAERVLPTIPAPFSVSPPLHTSPHRPISPGWEAASVEIRGKIEREMFYLTTHSTHSIYGYMGRERNVLFNDTLNTFYLRLYGIRHMVKDHSDSEKGNPLPPHRLLFPINSKGSFICTISQTGLHIPQPLLHQSWSTGWNEK